MYLRREMRLTLATIITLLAITVAGAFAGTHHYYVSTTGSNTSENGSVGAPWKTITYALTQVTSASSENPVQLHVAAGTYNTTLGETFPLEMDSYVSLYGVDPDTTIIDANLTDRVIYGDGADSVTIQGFTITNGYFDQLHVQP